MTAQLECSVRRDGDGSTALLPYASRVKIRATHVLGPLLAVSGLAPVTIVIPAPE